MTLIDDLCDDGEWAKFLEYRTSKPTCYDSEKEYLGKFVYKRMYLPIVTEMRSGRYSFTMPRKRSISKAGTDKRRTVYSFSRRENVVLKMMSHLLHRYDVIFSDNLYSYRRDIGVRQAVSKLLKTENLGRKYCYKADIHDYFNSVDVEKLLPMLERVVDGPTFDSISAILTNPLVLSDGHVVEERRKGIMAGMPISAFLANLYLMDLDEHFADSGTYYARYADDILVLADTEEELRGYVDYIHGHLASKGLEINPRKERIYGPGETLEFLGFGIGGGKVDLADITVKKTKAKIRRAARSITRWGNWKRAPPEARMSVMIRKFDRVFYGGESGELSWRMWYFRTVNVTDGMKEVDRYLQERIRWVGTGRNSKRNYEDVPYALLQSLGYRPLVHEYYLYILCSIIIERQFPPRTVPLRLRPERRLPSGSPIWPPCTC